MPRVVDIHSVVIQGLSILLICAVIELGAGGVFTGMQENFAAVLPGLIVMVPPLLGLRGNINGALASRLGTGLNTGLVEPRLKLSAEIKVNLVSALILSVIASVTIGILSFVVNLLAGTLTTSAIQLLIQLIMIAVVAGFISGLILASLTVVVAIFTFQHGWDPDNVTAPLMATIGDFVTIACIYLAVFLVI